MKVELDEPKQQFVAKPKASTVASRKFMGKPINLYTNQYWISFNQDLSVYQYEVQISPNDFHDSYITISIFKAIRR